MGSPDLKILVNVVKDVFLDHVSSLHLSVSSPFKKGTYELDGKRVFACVMRKIFLRNLYKISFVEFGALRNHVYKVCKCILKEF